MTAEPTFADAKVQAVFEVYDAKHREDLAKMKSMPKSEGIKIRDTFLLPVGREVGLFLHALVLAKRPKRIVEIGTSYGYSTLFLAAAAREVGAEVITMELADYKQDHARTALTEAGLADHVTFRLGDAVAMLAALEGEVDLALMDIWKELYLPCFDRLYPRLADEGIIATDNMIEPAFDREIMREYRAALDAKDDLETTLLPIGSGLGLTTRWHAGNPKR